MDEQRQVFDVMGVAPTRKQLTQITRSALTSIFAEMSEMLLLKVRQLRLVQSDLRMEQQWVDELRVAKDPARVKQLVDLLEQANMKEIEQLSFKNLAPEVREEMLMASAYDDEYAATRDKTGSFWYYFCCLSGGSDKCGAVWTSKEWLRLHPQAWATKQRWYCGACNARFRASWGVLVQIVLGQSLYYVRAACPDKEALDARALVHQRRYASARTPQALFEAIPQVPPQQSSMLRAVDPNRGHFKLTDVAAFLRLPEFDWDQVWTFAAGGQ
jgi:hypothetical protein